MNPFHYEEHALCCEDVPLSRLADAYGTPLYVYSADAIRTRCRELERAFGATPHLTCYAVKANANRTLLKLIAGEGLGADVGSVGELRLALHAGFPPAMITFSGVGKRDDEMDAALREEILAFNVESLAEIEVLGSIAAARGRTAQILLRANLDIDAGGHAYVSTSKKENKFGVPAGRAVDVLRTAASIPGIAVRGIHSHIGSQILNVETFVRAAHEIARLTGELRSAGIPIADLDFGGGFGVQYRGFVSHPALPTEAPDQGCLDPVELLTAVLPILRDTGCRISIQPGRAIVAQAGALLTRVLYRKETEHKTFLVVDGGMNDLIRPSLYHSYHQIIPASLTGAPHETVDVVGPVCESGDFFAQDRVLPRASRGDLLVLLGAGAYGYVLSSNYNARPRPAEVLVDGASRQRIRERERLEDL